MKKINNYELLSIIIIITITMHTGISINLIKEYTKNNTIISVILSNIIAIIPLFFYLYINNYQKDLTLKEKLIYLFKKKGLILYIFLIIIAFIIAITCIYNVSNFITSQLLYRTPQNLIIILFISLAIYHNTKGINSITRVGLILCFINIILFIVSFSSLFKHINLSNFLPILKENNKYILPSALKLTSINFIPLFLLLSIPKNKLSNPSKYTKQVIITYIVSAIISILIVFTTYGVLGKYLIQVFEYPEYIVLKKVTIFGFLERIENIVSNQWMIGNYIYITIIIYFISNILPNNKSTLKFNITNGILLLLTIILIFNNNTIFHNYINNIFYYITALPIIIYLIMIIKIFSKKIH